MRRREAITLIGSAAAAIAMPRVARAQQPMPVVGYLRAGSRGAASDIETAFRQGLAGIGFVEGRNVTIDYRYAENQLDLVPALAADLVRRQVDVIYAGDNRAALAAKAATANLPIVFRIGGDPIELGLVPNLSRPGGNMTGVTFLTTTTEALNVQMLHEAVPQAAVMGLLLNPENPAHQLSMREAQEAALKLGLELNVASAANPADIDSAFAMFVQRRRVQGLVLVGDVLFANRRQQLAALTMRHAIPAIYNTRSFPDAGGLMSYGASNVDADRLAGIYVGRVLKGDRPSDLPVQQSVKVELIINLIAAKALGLMIPLPLLGRADEVIE